MICPDATALGFYVLWSLKSSPKTKYLSILSFLYFQNLQKIWSSSIHNHEILTIWKNDDFNHK